MKTCLSVLACSVAALALPNGALAAKCAPPGNSGVDEYAETVPGVSCSHPSAGPGSGGGHGQNLSPATGRELSAQGPAGAAVARLVSSTAPSSGGNSASGSSASGGSTTSGSGGSGSASARVGTPGNAPGAQITSPPASGRSPLSALVHPIVTGSASGGVGVLLPVFLAVAAALILLGATILRRHGVKKA
jgi:hypothetical protein